MPAPLAALLPLSLAGIHSAFHLQPKLSNERTIHYGTAQISNMVSGTMCQIALRIFNTIHILRYSQHINPIDFFFLKDSMLLNTLTPNPIPGDSRSPFILNAHPVLKSLAV